MQPPSDNWKKLRRAVLERARHNMVERFEPLYDALLIVSGTYLLGFLWLSLMERPDHYGWVLGTLVTLTATAGAALPFITGSVLLLHFVSRRMEEAIAEATR